MAPADVHITIDARMSEVSGIGTYIQAVVPRVIARWTDARFTLLGSADMLQRVFASNPRVTHRQLETPVLSLLEQFALLRAIPRDTSLLWSPHLNIPYFYRGALAVTVHDVFHLSPFNASRAKRVYATVMFRRIVQHARVVFCNSDFTAAQLTTCVGSPRVLRTTKLGADPHWFEVGGVACTDPPYFLAIGNIKPHKNLRRLIEAFQRVADEIPHRLLLVGQRAGLRTIDDEVQTLAPGLASRIEFTGYVTQATLERYISGCDALIHPSLYEGFGLPPVEALASGKPVAVSRVTALPEVCGPMADYFDPHDVESIAAALRKRARASVGSSEEQASRRQWARQFDWDRCAAETHLHLLAATDDHRRGRQSPSR
ncbi:glycosyltransferase family 1 protein [soil metagenome]